LKEKIKPWGWIGIIISFLGVSLVAIGEGVRFEPAAFLILLAAISTSFYFVLQKPYLKKYSPLKFATYAIWSGTFFQIFFSRGLFQNIKMHRLRQHWPLSIWVFFQLPWLILPGPMFFPESQLL